MTTKTTYLLPITLMLFAAVSASADSVSLVTSVAAQAASDSIRWSQLGSDETILQTSFNARTTNGVVVSAALSGPNSTTAVVCKATRCGWTGRGFASGDSLLWTADAANSGNGPLTLTFSPGISGAGALIQADAPGQFTAKIEAFNGKTSLGSFTVTSSGDATYIGIKDATALNITSVVFSLTNSTGDLTDFAIDTVGLNTSAPLAITLPVSLSAATVGNAYIATTFHATGGTGRFTWSATGLPAGFILTSIGGLSGTPQTATGSPFSVAVTVTDGLSAVSKSYTLTVNGSGVQAVSVSPKSGSGLGPQPFTALYTDSSGYRDLQFVYLDFSSPTASCRAVYEQSGNAVFLYNDTGQILGPIPPGSQQSNSQCTLFGNGSGLTAAGTAGNNLTVAFNIAFKTPLAGVRNISGYAQSYSGANSAWQTLGSWTIPGQSLGVTSVTPNSGSGAGPVTVKVVATDPNGTADLAVVFLEFASSAGAAQSCFAAYIPAGDNLYLYSDDNKTLMGPVATKGPQSNHQCTLSSGGAVTPAGNSLTVPFTVKFLPGFTGSKNIYAYAQSATGGSGGWQLFGSWTLP